MTDSALITTNVPVRNSEAAGNATEQNVDKNSTAAPPTASKGKQRPKKRVACKFFATKKGCRSGDQCPFLHDSSQLESGAQEKKPGNHNARPKPPKAETAKAGPSTAPVKVADIPPQSSEAATRRLPPWGQPVVDLHRVVQRPVPKAASQDPRGFQTGQIKRRFNAREESRPEGVTELHFEMTPSDPDFPFEIDSLKCVLKLFSVFPMKPPSLRVSNQEMERGYQVNVEKGFDLIWRQAANPTLLGAMKELDKKLEQLLTAQKAEVIKIVAPVRSAAPKVEADLPREPVFAQQVATQNTVMSTTAPLPQTPRPSPERLRKARDRREEEVRLLEHRLGKDPQFAKLADGTIFTVPIQPRKRENLPMSLQSLKTVQLYVPAGYDVDPCSIELLGVEGPGVRNVEASFLRRVIQAPESSLLAHVNYLASNMFSMSTQTIEDLTTTASKPSEDVLPQPFTAEPSNVISQQVPETRDTDKSHVKIIARPPEWSSGTGEAASGSSEEEYSSYSETDSASDEAEDSHQQDKDLDDGKSSSSLRERGIMLSFPTLELHNIELLELQSASLTVKCDRCKDVTSVSNISNNVLADPPQLRSERCNKCAVQFSIGFRRDIMHANSIRAGYLDFEGCTPVDLLTCPFLPTCSQCSTVHPPVPAVRGDAAMAICRECHARLSFTVRETKFLRISAAAPSSLGTLPRKKPKDTLGIVAGTELPRTGRCRHYAKSHRWFRFSCCDRVYPCDRCHDAAEREHAQEFANRMICGYCSREQNYRPQDCGVCRRVLTGRRGTGFWEGGKGTRDRARMSRKDPRKYKRGTAKKSGGQD